MTEPALSKSFPRSALKQRTSVQLSKTGKGGGVWPTLQDFEVAPQDQNNWCWAAVSASVANYYAPNSWTQCQVASRELNAACCEDGTSDDCDQGYFLDLALQCVGHFDRWDDTVPLAAAVIENEIRNNRPLPIRVGWDDGDPDSGHFVAIRAITRSFGVSILDITDSIYGANPISIEALANGGYQQGHGRWTESFFVR